MSRAINIKATPAAVTAAAAKLNVSISAIEPLVGGGTRVVLMTADGAHLIADAFGKRVIDGAVIRTPWRQEDVSG